MDPIGCGGERPGCDGTTRRENRAERRRTHQPGRPFPGMLRGGVHRHYRHIYAYAARRLGRDLAEDVASETFLVAFDRRAGYDMTRADARPWLYGIASNLIARQGTAESRRYRTLAQLHEAIGSTHMTTPLPDGSTRQPYAVGWRRPWLRLPQSVRHVLLLVAWAGLNQNEAAVALDIPAGTARSRLHRAPTRKCDRRWAPTWRYTGDGRIRFTARGVRAGRTAVEHRPGQGEDGVVAPHRHERDRYERGRQAD